MHQCEGRGLACEASGHYRTQQEVMASITNAKQCKVCPAAIIYNKHIQTSDKHNYIYSALALSQPGLSFVCSHLKWFVLALQVCSIYIYIHI